VIATWDVYYTFADEVALELMIDMPIESEDFMKRLLAMAKDTTSLAIEFSDHAEQLIAHTLKDWGFKLSHTI
jgi:hypothetical protein